MQIRRRHIRKMDLTENGRDRRLKDVEEKQTEEEWVEKTIVRKINSRN